MAWAGKLVLALGMVLSISAKIAKHDATHHLLAGL